MPVDTVGATPGPRALHVVEIWALRVAMCCTMAICALVVTGVLTRALFNWSLPDMEIVVRDLMIGAVILPLAHVAAERAHIAVGIFVSMMPRRLVAVVDLLASMVGLLVLLPITYGGWVAFQSAWLRGDYAFGEFNLPVWPVRLVFWLGYLLFALRLAAMAVADGRRVLGARARALSGKDQG